MARWIYGALAVGWALSMAYECVHSSAGVAAYVSLGIVGVTVFVILFVRDVLRPGEQKPVPKMLHFLGAAVSAALFYMALERAAAAGTYIRFMPFYLVMFAFFFGAGVYTWWRDWKRKL